MVASTKECGRKTYVTERGLSVTRMAILIMDTSKWARLTARESIPGLTVRSMMASGCKDLSKVMESGGDFTMTAILVSGWSLRHMAMVCTLGKMEIDTKVNGTCVSSMARALTFFRTVILTPENTRMGSHMEKVNIHGRTGRLTWGIFWAA